MRVAPSIPCVTDAELVEQARRGDTAAFGELVSRHQAAVVRAARVVCRSHEEAEDVAQEAFVTAWTRLAGYRGEAQFKHWLCLTAKSKLIERLRFWHAGRRDLAREGMPAPRRDRSEVDQSRFDDIRARLPSPSQHATAHRSRPADGQGRGARSDDPQVDGHA